MSRLPAIRALAGLLGLSLLGAPSHAAAPPALFGHPIEYVIVTSDALVAEFAPLAAWKTESGVPAAIKTLSAIQAEYPDAADDAERVRLFLRDAHAAGARWALIGGDASVVPIRQAYTTFGAGAFLPTDLYYACLERNWNADGDGLHGEGYVSSSNPGDDADLTPELWVGRSPVATTAEARRFVDKTLTYEKHPAGDYEDRVLAAANADSGGWSPGVSIDAAELVEENLPSFALAPELHVTTLYERFFAWPGSWPETKAAVLDSLSEGYDYTLLIGIGLRTDFDRLPVADDEVAAADALALTNGDRLCNLYLMGARGDSEPGSLGRAFLGAEDGGAVTCVGSSPYGIATSERVVLSEELRLIFEDGVTARGEALGRARLPLIPYSTYDGMHRWTQMTVNLLGDPELRLWKGRPRTLSVAHPPLVTTSASGFEVVVEQEGAPLAGARVVAHQAGAAYARATTGADGRAIVPFASNVAGELILTVTATGARPYQSMIAVTGPVGVPDRGAAARIAIERVSPNPSAGAIGVTFTLQSGAPATLELLDLAGRRVDAASVVARAGRQVVRLDPSRSLPAGLYMLRLAQAGRVAVARAALLR